MQRWKNWCGGCEKERAKEQTDSVYVPAGSCIYCGMEQETILYYYPLPGGPAGRNSTEAAKKRWFQEAVLRVETLAEDAGFSVLGCPVPPFYYRKKGWKEPVLFEAMEAALHTAAGMTDTYVHPDILRLLAPENRGRWQPRSSTVKMLTKHLLGQQAQKALARTDMVTVLLGQPHETAQQLEMTWELLEPYLPRVNRMLLYYEEQEPSWDKRDGDPADREAQLLETAGTDAREELQEFLEVYYYEYGLVPQLVPYSRSRTTEGVEEEVEKAAKEETANETAKEAGPGQLRCGKERCGGVILDYCEGFRYPKIAAGECVYMDIVSDGGKQRLLGRKSPAVAYVSPLKYLDTMVKNSYDRKVKMT